MHHQPAGIVPRPAHKPGIACPNSPATCLACEPPEYQHPDGPPPADPDQPVWDYLDGVPPGGWTSIRNSPARRAVWEGGGDPDDPRNYDPEPESEGQ